MKTIATLLLVGTALVGCAGSTVPGGPAQPAGLAGRTFLSSGVSRAGQPFALAPNTQIRLNFDADGNLGASAGCNTIGGTWRLDGAVLTFEGGGMTEMGCDEPRHAQDEWLATFLASKPQVALDGSDLALKSADTVISLVDREIAQPDLPLVGTSWTVSSIVSGDAVSSIPDRAVATLQIAADGRVRIKTGCNEAGGTVTVDGTSIRFVDLVTTDMACQGAAGQLEQAVMAVLNADSLTWSIDASGLTIMAGPNGLILSGR
jgi:heat shock protein HslJ